MQVPAEHDDKLEGYYDEAFLVFQLRSHQFKVQIITEVETIKATNSKAEVESENDEQIPYQYSLQKNPILPKIVSFDQNGLLKIRFNTTTMVTDFALNGTNATNSALLRRSSTQYDDL